MGPLNLKIGLSSNVCPKSNRSNEQTTLLFIKCPKFPKTSFLSTYMGFMGPKPCFYGSLKPQMGFSSNVCLKSNRSKKKNLLLFMKCSKYPQTSFLSTYMGFMGPKPHCYGSHKPQNRFIK